MEIIDSLLNGGDAAAKIRALQASGDLNYTLKIFAPNFRLSGFANEGCQRAERGRTAGGTGHERIAQAVEQRTALLGETDADRIGAIIENYGRCRRLASQYGGGVQSDFLRREARAGSDGGAYLGRSSRDTCGGFD